MTLTAALAPEHWRQQLWEAVSTGDAYAATATVFAALDQGATAECLLLELIAPVQRKVGAEWAANRLTVAQEHAPTAINDRAISALSHHCSEVAPHGGRVTVSCVDGEWHGLPARILSEVLTLRGWRVDHLGAQVPTGHLITHVHRTGPDLVALSSSLATRLPAAHATITAVQATGTPVLVGGAAFGGHGQYARLLGADAWAADARAAADRLDHAPLRRPAPAHQPIDDLPHLADQEYTMVTRTRASLVRAVMSALEERLPDLRDYTPEQRARTAEDVAHIVDFLAAALYIDDVELFTGFLTWTAGILTARRVPARSLAPALSALGEQLRDFPRATLMLTQAAGSLARARSVTISDLGNSA